VIRFLDGSVKVLSETEFLNEFKKRASEPFWWSIGIIQTAVKSKLGLGKSFKFTFTAPSFSRRLKDPDGMRGKIEFNYS